MGKLTPNFMGDVESRWLVTDGPDRLMQLTAPFYFRDSLGVVWKAPAGLIFDGASIPRPLWSLVGDPFIGDYRRAAVLHDAGYQGKWVPRKHIDWMFYEAMRCDGVGFGKAQLIYGAVRLCGWLAWGKK